MIRALVVAALAALAATLPAATEAQTPSRRWGSVELGAERYRPDIDSEFSVSPGAYQLVFEGGDRWMFRLGVSKALYTGMGSLEVGLRLGYFQDNAFALAASGDPPVLGRTKVQTKLHIIPTSLALTYRFDWPVERYRIPLAPYVRATLERYNWWVSGPDGEVQSGATNGWSATAGLAFLLDILDRGSARDLDREVGVNHTYLFFEVTKSSIDDFGSSSSWILSGQDLQLGGGLLFVF